MVRCARCGGEWMAGQEASKDEPPALRRADVTAQEEPAHRWEPGFAPAVTAMDRLAAPAPRHPRPARLIAAWVATFVVLAASLAAIITWRDKVVHAWPASGRILESARPTPTASSARAAGTASKQ
jgi:hypothetical protein